MERKLPYPDCRGKQYTYHNRCAQCSDFAVCGEQWSDREWRSKHVAVSVNYGDGPSGSWENIVRQIEEVSQ